MLLLIPPYFLIALFVGGSAIWNGEYAAGFALFGASYLALCVGITARNAWAMRSDFAFHFQNETAMMALVSCVMFGITLALVHFFDLTVGPVDGKIWALIGLGLGLFSDSQDTEQEDTPDAKEGPDPER